MMVSSSNHFAFSNADALDNKIDIEKLNDFLKNSISHGVKI